MTEREALKLALEALEAWETGCGTTEYLALVEKAVTAIKEVLAQPEQEPDDLTIAYMSGVHDGKKQRTWVGLTDEDIEKVCGFGEYTATSTRITFTHLSKAVEAKLKEKNGA